MDNMTDYISDGVYHITDHYRAIEMESLEREELLANHKKFSQSIIDEAKAELEREYLQKVAELDNLMFYAYEKYQGRDEDEADEFYQLTQWAIKQFKERFNVDVIRK